VIEVGLTKTLPSGRKSRYKYADIKFDPDGWTDPAKYLPLKFDLVCVFLASGQQKTAWWSQEGWVGLRLPEGAQVQKWRRLPYESAIA